MTEEEKKAIEFMQDKVNHLERHIKNYKENDCITNVCQELIKEKKYMQTALNLIQTQQKELGEKDKIIGRLTDEREHIISNLKVDLQRTGIYSQAKGQIKQILEYYENNNNYFERK